MVPNFFLGLEFAYINKIFGQGSHDKKKAENSSSRNAQNIFSK